MTTNPETKYYGLAIDPLHVGTGGYRLGRVDNTIVRDPGSNLPKIPGSSLSGVCRNYAIYGLVGKEKQDAETCAKLPNAKQRGNCSNCLICKTFGYASGEDKKNWMGLVKFFDALIMAFPVATMYGPAWVTTAGILGELGVMVAEPDADSLKTSFDIQGGKLNLGWLYLSATKDTAVTLPDAVGTSPQVIHIKNRLVVAPEYLFSDIVNNNLEIRTSVAIDFKTGAAKKGALFTYEAIPRATLLAFDIVVDTNRCPDDYPANKVHETVELGLSLFEVLGLGGMNTRGFGRMKVINVL